MNKSYAVKSFSSLWKLIRRHSLIVLEGFILIALLVFAGGATYQIGIHGLETFDMSIVADGGYRIYLGQLPYRDFHIPMGPGVFYMQALFFAVFGGFTWKAVILHAAVVGAFATFIVYFTLRLYLRSIPALGFASVAALTFYMPIAFPWYDQTAFFFTLVAASSVCITERLYDRFSMRAVYGMAGLSGLALAASILSKQNIGLAALGLVGPLWLLIHLRDTQEKSASKLGPFLICLGTVILSGLVVAVFFQSQGSFYSDIFGPTNQIGRLRNLLPWGGRGDDLNLSLYYPFIPPYSFDVWLLLFTALGWGVLELGCPVSALRLRVILGVIVSLLVVSYIARKTGGGNLFVYSSLLALSVGLLYAFVSRIEPLSEVQFGRHTTIRLCLLFGLMTSILFFIALSHHSNASPGRFLLAGRWSWQWVSLLIAILFCSVSSYGFAWYLRQNSRAIMTLNLARICQIFVLLVVLSLTYIYTNYVIERKVWSDYPEIQGQLVSFTDVPTLDGMYAHPEMVKDIEQLDTWLRPKIDDNESLKQGKNIYIFPAGQLLYGVLGIESYRGVHLWYHYGLTYNLTDPDTHIVKKEPPKYVVLHKYGMEYLRETDKLQENLSHMPKLQRLLNESYLIATELDGYTILKLSNE